MEGQEKTVRGIKTFLKTLVTVVLFIIYMFPFYMIVLNAFKHKRDIIKMPLSWGGKRGFTTDNFVDAFQQMNFMNILKNSLIITCVSVFLIILFSSMAAYIFVRKAWKINQIIFMVMLFSMVIPFQVVMIPLISIYGGTFGILNHRATLIFMHLGFSVSMAVFMFHGFIKGGVPISLEEAAQIDGAGAIKRFFNVTLPMLSPTMFMVLILNIISSFQVFDLINIMTGGGPGRSTNVLVYRIYQEGFQQLKFGYASAMAYFLFLIVLIVTLIQFRGQKKWVTYM